MPQSGFGAKYSVNVTIQIKLDNFFFTLFQGFFRPFMFKIRDSLCLKLHILVQKIPGHAEIPGNEHADRAAKAAIKSPLQTFMSFSNNVIKRIASNTFLDFSLKQNWITYNHKYKVVNPMRQAINLPCSTTAAMHKCFIHLRFGHTTIIHLYLFKKEPQSINIKIVISIKLIILNKNFKVHQIVSGFSH